MRYLTATETAKLIRSALRVSFPAVKFTVKQSRGGSINIGWTDGPTVKRVDAVTDGFAGQGFDGSIDMRYQIHAWVLNGEVIGTESTGTAGSAGSVSAWGQIPPHDDAELVSFGADFIFCRRDLSPAFARKLSAIVGRCYGVEMPAIVEYMGYDNRPTWKLEGDTRLISGHYYAADLIHQASGDRTRFAE